MQTRFVTTQDGSLLTSVREALADADRVLICVAFAGEAGLRLLGTELEELRLRERPVQLVATTAFGSTTPAALDLACQWGVSVRTYVPTRGTFHPKVYLGIRDRGRARAMIGSANLTAGLVGNVEAGIFLDGSLRDEPLKQAWHWAESRWGDPVVEYWRPSERRAGAAEQLEPDLFALIGVAVKPGMTIRTLGRGAMNRVVAVTRTGLMVATERSVHGELVPAWMLNLAWGNLKVRGFLTNKYLLEELRVHRSSFVCALLAVLPGVEPLPGRLIGVRLRSVASG